MVFYCNCLNWTRSDVHCPGGLRDMIDQRRRISRQTFLRHVCRDSLRRCASALGYESHASRGLTMAGDHHVQYFRSEHHGETVYYFVNSSIEYVFKVQHDASDD